MNAPRLRVPHPLVLLTGCVLFAAVPGGGGVAIAVGFAIGLA